METTVTIKGVEEKESKAGRKYFSFETDQGRMTCFEGSLVEVLKKKVGEKVNVDVQETNGFKNIKKILTEVKTEKIPAIQAPIKEEKFEEARAEKNKSIYTSYAKDLFIVMLENADASTIKSTKDFENIMAESVKLVKQAIAAF